VNEIQTLRSRTSALITEHQDVDLHKGGEGEGEGKSGRESAEEGPK
jgi:hypothetical protein